MSLPVLRLRDLPAERRKEIVEDVLHKYEAGAKTKDLAKEYKLNEASLFRLIVSERPDDWRSVQAARALFQLENSKAMMHAAEDHLSLTKAEKLGNRAAWELERLLNRMYGPKQEETPNERITINIGIYRPGDNPAKVEEVIPGEVVA